MKANAIFLASLLLVGCQLSKQGEQVPEQHAQSLSSTGKAREYTKNSRSNPMQDPNNNSAAAQKDLWNSIRDELKMEVQENTRIRDQKIKYLKSKSYLCGVALRAEPYMHWIVGQVKQHNMPMELVLLPIVESAFDPHATSSANAAGLWQIVPQTGLNYGLTNNQWYDGRRDVAASTSAAIDIMQRLNRVFNGDWLLAIAAYNSGEGRVIQAIKANKRKGRPTNFWALSLPRETSVYVPKMLALSDIIKHSKQYGVNLPKTDKTRALARIDVKQQIMLAQAAKMAGLSITKMQNYNSGYKKGITAPNGPHYIMLPTGHAARLKNSLENSQITLSKSKRLLLEKNRSLSGGDLYRTQSSDRNSFSDMSKRLSAKNNNLEIFQNLLRANNALKAQQILKITSNNAIIYHVRRGDSLSSIARRHGVDVTDVMRWNSRLTKSHRLYPGITLTLFINNKLMPGT